MTMYQQPQYGGGWAQQGTTPQQPTQPAPVQPVHVSMEDAMGGGTPNAFGKNDPIGASVTGDITEIHAEQQTDFTTGRPLFWDNGDPRVQVVITLQTSLHDPADPYDDGQRRVYVKGSNLKSLRSASQQAGVGKWPRKGDRLTATFDHTTPAKTRGFNDAKNYVYQVTPSTDVELDHAFNQPENGMQTAAQPTPQPTVAPGAYAPQQGVQGANQAYQQIPHPQQPMGPDPQQVRNLAALGKPATEIARLLATTPDQINRILGTGQGSEDGEPEF